MKALEELGSQYIKKIAENVYMVDGFDGDEEKIKKAIIDAKHYIASKPIAFSLDDFVLVRITSKYNYPYNFKYFANDKTNSYKKIANPFWPLIGYLKYNVYEYTDIDVGIDHDLIEYDQYDLYSTRYRDTKHFCINSLASNIYQLFEYKVEFDKDKVMIIIEPLKERIEDTRLAVLNPVDTFFDLKDQPMEVSKHAVFMIEEEFYQTMPTEFRQKLNNHPIFIFKSNPALSVDLVLSFLGYIPQRSVQQSELKPEYYFLEDKEINDEEFIRQYQDYFEYLNNHYLHTTYLEVPEEYAIQRQMNAHDFVGLKGILHSETKYSKDEQIRNLESDIKTYREYITFMFKQGRIDELTLRDYLSLVEYDVRETGNSPIMRTFFKSFHTYEGIIRDLIIKLTYPEYERLKNEFNKKTLSQKDIKHQG